MPDSNFNSEQRGGRYDVWGCESHYDWDAGVIVLPVAGPPGTAPEVVQLHAGYGHRRVRSSGRRFAGLPTLPNPLVVPTGQALEGYAIAIGAAEIAQDGTNHYYEASGDYSYILTAQPAPSVGLPFAAQPFDSTGPANNVMNNGSFSTTIFPNGGGY